MPRVTEGMDMCALAPFTIAIASLLQLLQRKCDTGYKLVVINAYESALLWLLSYTVIKLPIFQTCNSPLKWT